MYNTANISKTMADFDHILARRRKLDALDENQRDYQHLSVIRKLSNSKFPVYLAFSKEKNQHYAMKTFPYIRDAPHQNFYNEIRFAFLKHPNIVSIVHSEKERETVRKGELGKMAYLLMDYAPYGDFFNFVTKHKDRLDEKLIRTYFRQLIGGIEYLHENGVAHLDLKPENLLIGADFNLKITDFDISHISGDPNVLSRGTKYYRAPEFFRKNSHSDPPVKHLFAADIYSAGVILFILKSGGIYPHAEEDGVDNGDFLEMMYKNNSRFWTNHCDIEGREASFYDSNFRKLFNGMVKSDPADRFTIKQIKKSKWYNGPVYSSAELTEKMRNILNCELCLSP